MDRVERGGQIRVHQGQKDPQRPLTADLSQPTFTHTRVGPNFEMILAGKFSSLPTEATRSAAPRNLDLFSDICKSCSDGLDSKF